MTCDKSNVDKPTSITENNIYHRDNCRVVNFLLAFIFDQYGSSSPQENNSEDGDLRIFHTNTQELEDAKDIEASEAHQVSTGMASNALNNMTDPEESDDDGIGVPGEDEINDMIDDYLNRFPDELDIYRRKGCSFMKRRANEEDEH